MIYLNLKALERSQHFSHYKSMGMFKDAQGQLTPSPRSERVHDNSSKDTSSNTTISLQRQLVYYDSLSNATLSLLLFLPTTSGRKIS